MVLVDTEFGDASGSEPQFSVAPWRDAMPGADEWDMLCAAASEPNPFFERWFLTPALTAFDPDAKVRLAQLRIDGKLVGLAPLAQARSYYQRPVPHLAVWLHPNAFCGVPLVARGFEAMFWSMLLRWADDHAGAALFLHLPGLPESCDPDAALSELSRDTARKAGIVEREERALLSSDLSAEAYFEQALPNKKRKELRRQARRLSEQGDLTVARVDKPADAGPWADAFLALEAASWKGREGSALACDPAHARFFRETLVGAASLGRIECLALNLDGRPIAMLANFLTPPGSFSFKTAFDEDFARFSPGVLLQKENLDLLDRGEIAWCDSCAAPDHPMIDHFWRGHRTMVSRNLAIGGDIRRAIGGRLIAYETRNLDRSAAA